MVEVELKEWGNSLGVIIPKEITKQEKIESGQEIVIDIRKGNPLKELFGSLKFSKPTKELLIESRKNTSEFD